MSRKGTFEEMFAYHVHVLVSFKYLSNKKNPFIDVQFIWVNRSSNVNLSHNQFTQSINREPPCLQISVNYFSHDVMTSDVESDIQTAYFFFMR